MRRSFPYLLFFLVWFQGILFVNPTGTVMTDATLSTAINLVERGTLEVDGHAAIDLMKVNNRLYAGFGPGQWLLAAPFYAVLRPLISVLPDQWTQEAVVEPYSFLHPKRLGSNVVWLQVFMVWLLVAPMSALLACRMFQFAFDRGSSTLLATTVSLGLASGSLAAIYGAVYSKQWLVALILAGLCLHELRPAESSWRSRAVAGLLAGLGIWIEYSAALAVILLGLWMLARAERPRDVVLYFGGGLALMSAALLAYHYAFFGDVLKTPYHFRIWYFHDIRFSYKDRIWDVGDLVGRGSIGILPYPSAAALWGLTFSQFKGLFYFVPFLLPGLAGLIIAMRQRASRDTALLCLGIFLVYLWMMASLNGEPYWSGWPAVFGPRYLVYAVPFLSMGIVLWQPTGILARTVIVVSVLLAIGVQSLGLMFQDTNWFYALDSARVQAPISHFAVELWNHGPRVPLLDRLGVAHDWQGLAVLAWLLGLAFTAARLLRWKSQRTG